MNESYTPVGKGLQTMFIAQIVGIVSSFIPVLGLLGMIAAGILTLVGLNTASKGDERFRTAMSVAIAGIVVSIVEAFVPEESVIGLLVTLVSGVVSLILLYLVCNTAAEMVEEKGDYELAQKGRFVWKLDLVCMIVVAVCTAVVFIPIINILAAVAAVGAAIAAVVGAVLYMIFLYKASEYLRY